MVRTIFVVQQNVNILRKKIPPEKHELTQVAARASVPAMKGRPKKDPDDKMGARVPFVASATEKADYKWATKASGEKSVSEWIRKTLNDAVKRLRKKS